MASLTPQQLGAMTMMGNNAPSSSGPLTPDQLNAMVGMGLQPNQSAQVLGHANGVLQNTLNGAKDLFTGIGEAGLSTLQNTANLGGEALNQTGGRIANAVEGKGFTPTTDDFSIVPGKTSSQVQNALTPQNTMQNIGNIAGNIAPYAIAPETKGPSLLEGASGLIPKVAQGIGNFVTSNIPSFLKNTAIGTAQTGNPVSGVETGAGATALKGMSGFAGTLLKHLTGFTSGVGANLLQQAFDNPGAVQKSINEYAQNPEAAQTLVDRMKSGISSFLQDRSEQYGKTLGSLPTNGGVQPQLDVLGSFSNNLAKYGGQVTKDGLQFTDTTLTKEDQGNLKQAYGVINNWKDTSTAGMDKMRQAIGNLMDDFKLAGNDRANAVLGNVVNDLKTSVNSSAPGYNDMLATYGKQTQLARDVMKELNLGGNARPSTQLNSIMKLFNKDPSVVSKVQNIMGEKSDQFMNDLTGSILSEWLPEGKVQNWIRGAGEVGAATIGASAAGPIGAAAAIPGLASISPRIVGEGAVAAGAIAKTGIGQKTASYISSLGSDIANKKGNQNTQ